MLFGGAINLAGQVKAKRDRRSTRSDWMAIERERGISVVTSVMTFDYDGRVFNLLDTPGHEDFSEDTYRTLTAVDSAVMVIDAAKGIEARTRKLFEVCRLRDIPIVTFINKMDRESRDPFELLDEIEKTLALDTAPMTWPIGRGRDFAGTYDLATGEMRLVSEDGKTVDRQPLDLAALAAKNLMLDTKAIGDELALGEGGLPAPLISNRSVRAISRRYSSARHSRISASRILLDALADLCAGAARAGFQCTQGRCSRKLDDGFRLQDPGQHGPQSSRSYRLRTLCSGKLRRGMKAKLTRTAKPLTLSTPQFFFAQDRALAEEAYAGDVVGIPNHGTLRIGDTLTEGEDIAFLGVPNFAPEILRRVKLGDPMKAKKLKEALQQMAEEGVVQVFRPLEGAPALVGVVGPLQLDVLKVRLSEEYGLEIGFEQPEFQLARWIAAADNKGLEDFVQANYSSCAEDLDGDKVFMARNQFILDYTRERALGISFTDIKDVKDKAAA